MSVITIQVESAPQIFQVQRKDKDDELSEDEGDVLSEDADDELSENENDVLSHDDEEIPIARSQPKRILRSFKVAVTESSEHSDEKKRKLKDTSVSPSDRKSQKSRKKKPSVDKNSKFPFFLFVVLSVFLFLLVCCS